MKKYINIKTGKYAKCIRLSGMSCPDILFLSEDFEELYGTPPDWLVIDNDEVKLISDAVFYLCYVEGREAPRVRHKDVKLAESDVKTIAKEKGYEKVDDAFYMIFPTTNPRKYLTLEEAEQAAKKHAATYSQPIYVVKAVKKYIFTVSEEPCG